MKNLSVKDGLKAAVKTDTLSLTAWQVGMYGWMAIVGFLIFGHELEKTNPTFWFMMQIATFSVSSPAISECLAVIRSQILFTAARMSRVVKFSA